MVREEFSGLWQWLWNKLCGIFRYIFLLEYSESNDENDGKSEQETDVANNCRVISDETDGRFCGGKNSIAPTKFLDYYAEDGEDSEGSDEETVEDNAPRQADYAEYYPLGYMTRLLFRKDKKERKIEKPSGEVNSLRTYKEVNVCTTQLTSAPVESAGDVYQLKNPYCVVIVNVNFQGIHTPRNGAETDRENIEHLLTKIACFKEVNVYSDCKRSKMLHIIDEVASSDRMNDHDGFVCFISSHGTRKGIRAWDKRGIVAVDELTTRLNGKQCPGLRGKPKLFFISACRGKKTDRGVPTRSIASDADDDEVVVPKLPTEADFLICYATTKNHRAFRRSSLLLNTRDPGSWFIKVLTEEFCTYMHKEELMQMMARVNYGVAQMATGDDHENGLKQMPVQMHMLRKRVVFGNRWEGFW